MINAMIRFAVTQRLLVMLLVAIMIGAGVYSLQRLPIDAVPDVTNVQVQVLTAAPVLAPLEIERQITFPVEVAMSGLPDIEEIRSVSKFGLSAVTVVFARFGRHLFRAPTRARTALAGARTDSRIHRLAGDGADLHRSRRDLQYELRAAPGSGYDPTSLRTIQDWNVRRQLLGVPGVTEVNSFGGLGEAIPGAGSTRRNCSPTGSLCATCLKPSGRNNANVGGAYIEHGSEQYLLRGIGLVESADDIANIVVKTGKEGVPVYVRDLGEVVDGRDRPAGRGDGRRRGRDRRRHRDDAQRRELAHRRRAGQRAGRAGQEDFAEGRRADSFL